MPYNFVVSVHISSFLNLLQLKNLYCNLTDASLWRVRRNKDILYLYLYSPSLHITGHHYTSLSITTHHYPSLQITVHYYTSLSITTDHYPSLHITNRHYASLSITTRHYTLLPITPHHLDITEAFIYARNHSQFYDLLNGDKNEVTKKQQCVKNTRSSIKEKLQKKFSQDWLKVQSDISESSRQKYTN